MIKWAFVTAALLAAAPVAAEDLPVIGGIAISPKQVDELRVYVGREAAPLLPDPLAEGARIPTLIDLHILPPFLTTEIPAVRTYRYVRTPTRIAIVNPDDRKVIRTFEVR